MEKKLIRRLLWIELVLAFCLLLVPKPAAAEDQGWRKVDGKWYYYDSHNQYYTGGAYKIDGEYYTFGDDGVMLTGWIPSAEDKQNYATASGAMVHDSWKKIDGKWYYFNYLFVVGKNGGPYTVKESGNSVGKTYLFDRGGALIQYQPGVYEYTEESGSYKRVYRYTINSEGVIQKGWVKYTLTYIPSGSSATNWYYYDESGQRVTDWQKINGKWYYFKSSGLLECPNGGTCVIDGKRYVFEKNGDLVMYKPGTYELKLGKYGWPDDVIETFRYRINSEGVVQPGWQESTICYGSIGDVSGTCQYLYRTCWQYVDENGNFVNGWYKVNKKWYYFFNEEMVCLDGGTFSVRNGSSGSGATLYLFAPGGALVQDRRDFIDVAGSRYYVNYDGSVLTGWKTIDGKKYYFDPDSGEQIGVGGGPFSAETLIYAYCFDNDGALIENAAGEYTFERTERNGLTWTIFATINDEGYIPNGIARFERPTKNCGYDYVYEEWRNLEYNHRGLKTIDGKQYLFASSGVMMCPGGGAIEMEEGKMMLFAIGGALIEHPAGLYKAVEVVDSLRTDIVLGVGFSYIYRPVKMSLETLRTTTHWYCFDESGTRVIKGWKKVDGTWYYFDQYGRMVCTDGGTYKIDGKYYLFAKGGALVQYKAGWNKIVRYHDDGITYRKTEWYYTDTEGVCRTGWQEIDGKTYYFYSYGELCCPYGGDAWVEGELCRFDETGAFVRKVKVGEW